MLYEIVTRDKDGIEWSVLKGSGPSILRILGFKDDTEDLESGIGFEVKIKTDEGQEYILKGDG
tara:strand:+ start:982 stop:1170 length:189 start_codon:yes stop_codon:yes gene_type:complete